MIRDVMLFIEDILDSITKIESFSEGLTKEKLLTDDLHQSAIIRQLEIIGEAVKNIPDKFREKYSGIQWRKIAGLRDVIIHAYFGINLDRVWDIIKADLPDLKQKILKIKDNLEKEHEKTKIKSKKR